MMVTVAYDRLPIQRDGSSSLPHLDQCGHGVHFV